MKRANRATSFAGRRDRANRPAHRPLPHYHLPHQLPPPAPTPTPPPAPVALVAGPLRSRCSILGCGQTRIADDCSRHICRKHCIEQGGCTSKKHKGTASLSLPASPPLDNATTLPPLPPAGAAPLPHLPTPPTVPTNNQPLDARPDPRFASHLRPIYVESLAREQTLEFAKAKLDAERIASAKQAAQKVTVHAWMPHVSEPESRQIQKGFTWPFFKLSAAILSLVNLQQSAESGDLQMYDETDDFWVTVDLDHIMEVREGQRVFLRDRSVRSCQGFDELFKQVSHPHLRNNLAQERAYVRNAWKALSPDGGSSSSSSPPPFSQKRKAISPPNSFPPPVKRERLLSTPLRDLSPTSPTPPTSVAPIANSTDASDTPAASTSGGGSAEDPIELSDGDEKKWPRDFYVCEIAPCFRDAKTSVRGSRARRTAAIIFHEHFPRLEFHSSTFSDNKAIWKKASRTLKNRYLVIGKRKAGLWSTFATEVKKETAKTSSPADAIELSDSE
jgi:hypothetical protein